MCVMESALCTYCCIVCQTGSEGIVRAVACVSA
jgi:hypothetical protein